MVNGELEGQDGGKEGRRRRRAVNHEKRGANTVHTVSSYSGLSFLV